MPKQKTLIHLSDCLLLTPPNWDNIRDSILFTKLAQYNPNKLALFEFFICSECYTDYCVSLAVS